MGRQALAPWGMPRVSDESITRSVGRRLRAARERAGITQAELAERAGLQAESISRIETGQRALSLGNLGRLATALEVGLGDLIDEGRAEPMPRLSAEETKVLEMWRGLGERDRGLVMSLVKAAARST